MCIRDRLRGSWDNIIIIWVEQVPQPRSFSALIQLTWLALVYLSTITNRAKSRYGEFQWKFSTCSKHWETIQRLTTNRINNWSQLQDIQASVVGFKRLYSANGHFQHDVEYLGTDPGALQNCLWMERFRPPFNICVDSHRFSCNFSPTDLVNAHKG